MRSACWVLLLLLTVPLAAAPLKVDVTAKAAILVNAETGAVLFEKNAHTPLSPASTTKVITAACAMQKMKGYIPDEMITASYEALAIVPASVRRANDGKHPRYRLEFGGTHMGLKVGETLPLKVLMYGLMLSSGNDAANVIAQHLSGDIGRFVEEMNAFAREKGCRNTSLKNPHGLTDPEHVTTAFDMAILAREYLKYPFLREVAKTVQCKRPVTNKQPESVLHQHNPLIRPGRFHYPKSIGIKTGYTLDAGYCIVAAAEDPKRKLIAVVMGCDKIENRNKDAIALFEAGFNEKTLGRTLFSKGFDQFSCDVEGGKIPLQASLEEDIVLEYYPSEEPVFKTKLAWQGLNLPIAAGQKVGEMQVLSQEGKLLSSRPLFALKAVESTFAYRANLTWKKVKKGIWDRVAIVMAFGGVATLAVTFYYSSRKSKRHKAK
jgi:D-alanyl-D-alanine carboxypeptidase (penicillin-binding protein 5/6)